MREGTGGFQSSNPPDFRPAPPSVVAPAARAQGRQGATLEQPSGRAITVAVRRATAFW